ncbi:MAG: GNAT family N-acetyltransferase [Anaerolineales bacterium]|nr:GNAT family N-acetyltransferase [Anaerolineales bacterium]
MKFESIETLETFESLAAEWNALLAGSVTNVPFLRHEYARAWWASLGGGEWPSAELQVVAGRDPTGRLVGLAPLIRLPGEPGPALHLLGSFEISDYLDLLVSADEAAPFVSGLLDFLAQEPVAGWHTLELYNLPNLSPVRGLMLELAAQRGWRATEEPLQPCPVISLPENWEGYLQSLDKKQRHELRRKLRRAEGNLPGVSLRWVDQPGEIESAMGAFLRLMRLDPQKSGFLTEAMDGHFRRLATEAKDDNWLRLAFLDAGGEPAAGYLFFDYGNRLWIYNSCLDPAFSQLSPGWVLTGMLIEWAVEHGRDEFDFLRGGEAYKFRLGGVARSIFHVRIERSPG